jgi:hypothetical protein
MEWFGSKLASKFRSAADVQVVLRRRRDAGRGRRAAQFGTKPQRKSHVSAQKQMACALGPATHRGGATPLTDNSDYSYMKLSEGLPRDG